MTDKWAEYKKSHCGCQDASRFNSCQGLANCELPANHPARKACADHSGDAADMGGQAGEEVEVVATVSTMGFGKHCAMGIGDPIDKLSPGDELMAVAQHRRILAQHRQQAGKLVEALRKIHFRADCFVEGDRDMPVTSIEVIVSIAGEALADWEKTNG